MGVQQFIFFDGSYGAGQSKLRWNTDDSLQWRIAGTTGSLQFGEKATTAKYRDVGAWYHIVLQVDSTQGTAADRAKLYINGEIVTDYQGGADDLDSNQTLGLSEGTGKQLIGGQIDSGNNPGTLVLASYLAEFNFIQGATNGPGDFGETDEDTNEWKAKKYAGSYGTNGFFLEFKDSGALGADTSGNGNNWTSTNLAATDQMLDSPQNSKGSNFATFNPLIAATQEPTLSEGNLQCVSTSGTYGYFAGATIGVSSGKWYAEYYHKAGGGGNVIGIMPYNMKNAGTGGNYIGSTANTGTGYYGGGQIFNYDNAGNVDSGPATFDTGDLIGVALDLDDSDGKVYFYKNGTLQDTGLTNDAGNNYNLKTVSTNWTFGCALNANWTNVANFGQDSSFAGNKTAQGNMDSNGNGDFYYTPPAGYLALCTNNLPDPAIALPGEHFNTVLYTGTGTAIGSGGQAITGVGFQPDFTWIKKRDATARSHVAFDVIRGGTNALFPDTSAAQEMNVERLNSWQSDGFTVGNEVTVGVNTKTYVSWNWKAGGAGVANTDGTINSTVSVNADAGFSIVKWVGTGTGTPTVGHGLSVVPDLIITKQYTGTTYNWATYSTPTGIDGYINLDQENAWASNATFFDNAPTASVFTPGSHSYVNPSGESMMAYCFHNVEGYSKVGSYVGNAAADGTFVYTGFRPAFLIAKNYGAGSKPWVMYDDKRDTYNEMYKQMVINNVVENTSEGRLDFVSNGIKWRIGDSYHNDGNFIYIAFAESPFKYARAR